MKHNKEFKIFLILLLIASGISTIVALSPLANQKKISSIGRIADNRKPARVVTVATSASPQTAVSSKPPRQSVPFYALNSSLVAFNAPDYGDPYFNQDLEAVVGIAALPDGKGYFVLRSNGQVSAYGTRSYGSTPALPPSTSAMGIAVDPKTGGYWVVASNGVVYAFNAPNLGYPNIPAGGWGQYPAAVAITSAPNGNGYYVLRANGEVDSFGVPFYGSLSKQLYYGETAPVVATSIAVDPETGGYWILTSTAQVYGFNAPLFGEPSQNYNGNSAVSIVSNSSGTGYYLLRTNGEVDAYGVHNYGSATQYMPVGAIASSMAVDVSTGGYWTVFDYSPKDGYLNPLRGLTSLVPQEIDQGVDYCGFGPIYPIGQGVVLNVYSNGWPGGTFIVYKLSTGLAAGYNIYVAENVKPEVFVGQIIYPTTILGYLSDSGNCLETGWASLSNPDGFAMAYGEYNGRNSTAYGINFSQLLEDLGSRPGLVQDYGPPGPIPSNWPNI